MSIKNKRPADQVSSDGEAPAPDREEGSPPNKKPKQETPSVLDIPLRPLLPSELNSMLLAASEQYGPAFSVREAYEELLSMCTRISDYGRDDEQASVAQTARLSAVAVLLGMWFKLTPRESQAQVSEWATAAAKFVGVAEIAFQLSTGLTDCEFAPEDTEKELAAEIKGRSHWPDSP